MFLPRFAAMSSGERIAPATAYHGTLRMFERRGFEVVERRQWNAGSPVRPIVRLRLTSAADEA